MYLDSKKAFDKVPHKRMMLKIKSLGITDKIYNWIEDWLKGRVQRVVLLGSSLEQSVSIHNIYYEFVGTRT